MLTSRPSSVVDSLRSHLLGKLPADELRLSSEMRASSIIRRLPSGLCDGGGVSMERTGTAVRVGRI